MELDGARVLVTGGSRRVGRALCDGLAARGARIAFTHRGTPPDAPGQHAIEADLADALAARAAVEAATVQLGGLDVLVHAASGGFTPTAPDAVTPELFDEAIGATLRGGFFSAQAAHIAMAERGGVIVLITDVAIHQAWPQFAPHAAAKAGLAQLTRSLAKAWAPGVRVCSVAPGPVLMPDTASDESIARHAAGTALGRLGSPADVVEAVVYLIGADFVTGTELVVDGGYRL